MISCRRWLFILSSLHSSISKGRIEKNEAIVLPDPEDLLAQRGPAHGDDLGEVRELVDQVAEVSVDLPVLGVPLEGTGPVTLGPLRVGDGTPAKQVSPAIGTAGDALEVDVAVEGEGDLAGNSSSSAHLV